MRDRLSRICGIEWTQLAPYGLFGSRNLCDLASEANHKDAYQSAGVLYTMFIDYNGRALEVSRAILSN
jgi:hypothetical protein